MTDEQAIQIFKSGNNAGLGYLYDKYFPAIYRYLYWQVGDGNVAEDLTSGTMLALAKSLRNFAGRASFKNYLYQIAKNQLNSWIRQNRYELPLLSLLESHAAPLELIDPETQDAAIAKLNTLLSRLTSAEQKLLRLRYLQNYSVDETAVALGVSTSNVKVKTHRLLEKLRHL